MPGFLFSCNEIPRNYGDRSEGFYRRLLIIRFEKSVPKAKRDPNLAEKLAAERDGILMWALTGLKRLIASGYVFSETERTRAELEKYRIESNSVLSFAKLYCVAEEEGVTVRDDLFLRYKEYCGNAGMKPVSQTNFNKELEAGFPEITRGRDKLSKRRIWRGSPTAKEVWRQIDRFCTGKTGKTGVSSFLARNYQRYVMRAFLRKIYRVW